MGLFRRKDRPPDPVKVAWAAHQAEAELIQERLREQGIPSMTRRQGAFDVPDFLAAGARDIYVPASAAEKAREILAETEEPLPGE